MTEPSDFPLFPDRTIPVTRIPTPPQTAVERLAAQSDNRFAVEWMVDYLDLPHPVVVPTHERVYVTVADADDLLPWLYERGGRVHVAPAFEGFKTYVLHTRTDPRSDGSTVEVWVSCSVHEDASVYGDILAAVAA